MAEDQAAAFKKQIAAAAGKGKAKKEEFQPLSGKMMARKNRHHAPPKGKKGKGGKGKGGGGLGSTASSMSSPLEEAPRSREDREQELALHVERLADRISMPEEEIRDRFWQFVEDCPSGFLTKDHFIQLASDMLGPEAETMGETIFKVFDEDGSGRMDFCEYMMAVQSSKLETPEDKLKWIFRIYDKNYSNSIDTDELSTMFWTLFEVSGIRVTETQMMTLVTDVMQTLDEDGNDAIDIVEFVDGSLKNKFIYDLLTSADENVRKQQEQQ